MKRCFGSANFNPNDSIPHCRAVEAVRHLPSPVIQFTRAGDMIYHNSVAIKIFGPTINQHNVMTLFVDSVYGQVRAINSLVYTHRLARCQLRAIANGS
jgi:hypothetical protein